MTKIRCLIGANINISIFIGLLLQMHNFFDYIMENITIFANVFLERKYFFYFLNVCELWTYFFHIKVTIFYILKRLKWKTRTIGSMAHGF